MKKFWLIVPMLVLSGCMTLSGNYAISAYDNQGKLLTGKLQLTAAGSGIYSMINAICSAYPKATLIIKFTFNGEKLQGESPYQFR